ncbi:uncharacterized protein [Heterodontus francisci]|uniref:uncharacterized protein n=1 Tax=Heterodontus francisci TaxID=7792 RepID=UPI00355C7DBB
MTTPQTALQTLLDRNFEAVGHGWVPAHAQPPARIAAKTRCQPLSRPQGSWMLHLSPIELLFKGRVDMDKVCDWFMQTTETRSLTITRRSAFRKQLQPEGVPAGRRRAKGQPRPPQLRKSPRNKAARGGGAAAKLEGNSPLGMSSRRAGCRSRGWNLQHPSSNNWWSRELVRHKQRKRQRATPTASPQGHQQRKADKNSGQTEYQTDWGDFQSPPVLSVQGTDYKLVPIGNSLAALDNMRRELSATGEPPSEGSCPRLEQQGALLTEARRQLGCLRECWVLLRNIADPKALDATRSNSCSTGKSASVRVNHRKRRRWAPVYYQQRAPGSESAASAGRAEHQRDNLLTGTSQVPSVNRAKSRNNRATVSDRDVELPASGNTPEIGPASSIQLESAVKSQEQKDSPQQENHLGNVRWQLVGLKECRVILRKVKALDVNHLNGLAVHQPAKTSSPCKHLDQDFENLEETENGGKAEHHIDPPETDSSSCEESQHKRLAANNQDAGISAFVKGFSSTNELESTIKPQEKDTEKHMKDTFTDTKWKLKGLKECRVVLKKIIPLDGNFISLVDGQLFRLSRNNVKAKSNHQKL